MPDERSQSHDAVTTLVGVTTICPQCGVVLDTITTTCGACGAVITAGGPDSGRAERLRHKLQEAIGDAFVLGDMLGRGGMGIVFRARERALDRDVALKVLAFDPVLNPEAYTRFEREAKLAAKLDHPNIVPIFSVGQRNAIAFYTMRMVKGGSVEQMVTPGRGLDVSHAISILRDVASALDYAHASGVVHRDIKPANILVGDSGHALVADFGIARAFGGDAAGATATGTGVVGSPAYMSPEQWRGEKVDGRADQYALGVLAFELLSGRRPFTDASMQELLRMHISEDPPDIISLRQDLPSHVTDAIWRAMAKDPADRYPSATGFVRALAGDSPTATTGSRASASVSGAGESGVKTMVKQVTPLPSTKSPPSMRTAQRSPAPRRSSPVETGGDSVPGVPSPSHRSMWIIAALLVSVGALGAVAVLGRPRQGQERTAAAPPPAAAAASADSLASLQREQSIENAKLQKELDDARRIALEAERKVEQMAAASTAATGTRPKAAVAEAPHAHLLVLARGGAPQVWVDGARKAERTPAAIELPPGRHSVSVKGTQEFLPPEFNVELAPDDTQQVVFLSKTVADAGAAPRGGTQAGGRRGQGPNWDQVIRNLGFDPRTVRPDTLAPAQRRQYQKFMQRMDSARKANRPPPS
jgi:serine/threonine-protein kinase